MPSRIRLKDGVFSLVEDPFTAVSDDWAIPQGDRAGFRAILLQRFAEPPTTRIARGTHARAVARRTFDPARQVAAYLELFRRLGAKEFEQKATKNSSAS